MFAMSGAGTACCVSLVGKIFTAARVAHTVIYLGEVPQPARGIAFFVGVLCNVYLGVKVLVHLY